MNTYEIDLNDLKEQILKDGDTLVSKRDLLERFCEIDKEYNGHPWNLLQILANINILIGEEPCEDCVSRQALDNALYERFHDEDAPNNMTDVRLGAVRNFVKDFPSVTSAYKKEMQESVLDKIRTEIEQIEINGYIRDVECFRAGINVALNVIDKYKAENEEE